MNIRKLSRDIEKIIKMVEIVEEQYSVGKNKDWENVKATLNHLKIQALIDEETDKDYQYWESDRQFELEELRIKQEELEKQIKELENA